MKKLLLCLAAFIGIFAPAAHPIKTNTTLVGAGTVGLGGFGYGLIASWRKMKALEDKLAVMPSPEDAEAYEEAREKFLEIRSQIGTARLHMVLSAVGALISAFALKKGLKSDTDTAKTKEVYVHEKVGELRKISRQQATAIESDPQAIAAADYQATSAEERRRRQAMANITLQRAKISRLEAESHRSQHRAIEEAEEEELAAQQAALKSRIERDKARDERHKNEREHLLASARDTASRINAAATESAPSAAPINTPATLAAAMTQAAPSQATRELTPAEAERIARLKQQRAALAQELSEIEKAIAIKEEEEAQVREHAANMLAQGIEKEAPDLVSKALQLGANPNAVGQDGATPLMSTLEKYKQRANEAHKAIIDLLVKAGANPIQESHRGARSTGFPLTFAVANGYCEITTEMLDALRQSGNYDEVLKEMDFRVDSPAARPLIQFAYSPKMAALLHEAGCDINARGQDGRTLLHIWATLSTYGGEAITALIQMGAAVNACDGEGKTPLMVAQSPKIVKALLEGNADVNVQDAAGNTALHYCSVGESIEQLLNAGARTGTENKAGLTPLLQATFNGQSRKTYALLNSNKVAAQAKTPEYLVQNKALERALEAKYGTINDDVINHMVGDLILPFIPESNLYEPAFFDALKVLADKTDNTLISRALEVLKGNCEYRKANPQ